MTTPFHDNPFRYARERDPLGDRVHLVLAAFMLATLPLGTTPAAIGTAVAGGYALLRIWATFRCYALLFGPALVTLLAAQAIWLALSLAWSPDLAQGFDEVGILRLWAIVPLVLWPVMDRLDRVLIGLMVGAVLLTLAQFAQLCGLEIGSFNPGVPNRFPGFGHPSSAAIIHLTVGILAINLAVLGSGWKRAAGVVLVLVAGGGLVLTFSRGPWIAALIAWPVAVGWCGVMGRRRGTLTGRSLAVGVVVLLIGASSAVLLFGSRINDRVQVAREEIRIALVDKEYRTDVGARIRQIEVSWILAKKWPWFGVGVGGYVDQARLHTRPDDGLAPASRTRENPRHGLPILTHPHCTPLYYLITGGFPALALHLAVWGALFVGLMRHGMARGGIAGVALPVVCLGIGAAFLVDCHNLSSAGTTIFMILVTAAIPLSSESTIREETERAVSA